MNWFKKTFTRNKWETVLTEKCTAKHTVFGVYAGTVNAVTIVQIEPNKKKVRAILTDGNTESSLSVQFVVAQLPELIEILKTHNIPY